MAAEEKNEKFDPSEHTAAEVKDALEEASEDEKRKIAAAEAAGRGRKTVLSAAGLQEGVRVDASGRVMHPWEVAPKADAEPE